MKIKQLTSILVLSCFLNSCSGRVSFDNKAAEIEHTSRVLSHSGRHVRASIKPGSISDRLARSYSKRSIQQPLDSRPSSSRLAYQQTPKSDQWVEATISLKDTPQVRKYIDLYTGKGKRDIEEPMERRVKHLPVIEKVLSYFNLPLELSNVAFVESKFNEKAVSPRGALGIWQFMKPTARELGLRCNFWNDERQDVLRSSIAAAKYLRDLNERFGDWLLALAAYNAGPGRVSAAIERAGGERDFYKLAERKLLPKETVNHVSKVVALTLLNQRALAGNATSGSKSGVKKAPARNVFGDLPLHDDNV